MLFELRFDSGLLNGREWEIPWHSCNDRLNIAHPSGYCQGKYDELEDLRTEVNIKLKLKLTSFPGGESNCTTRFQHSEAFWWQGY